MNCARQIDGERDLFFLQKQRQFIVQSIIDFNKRV